MNKNIKKPEAIILSASRMTDMPAWYPRAIIDEYTHRRQKGKSIHTLVLWTKHPEALFREPLHAFLERIKREGVQLFLQLTVTGMGGMICGTQRDGRHWKPEPKAPSPEKCLGILPEIINFLGTPDRILLRIDPLIKIRDAVGKFYSNVPEFEKIAEAASAQGIRYYTFSLVQPGIYRKVDQRFEKEGISLLAFSVQEQKQLRIQFQEMKERLRIHISACCVDGWATSACIDGEKFMKLHPLAPEVSLRNPHSRPQCGCTLSTDLGGWPPKACPTGCIYCYARPQR
jgi:hypothetical protein